MKSKKLTRNLIIISVAGIFVAVLTILGLFWFIFGFGQDDMPCITFSQKCGKDDTWTYQLSNDMVLKEVFYSESQIFSNKTQKWKFQIIGEGEVSIKWSFYDNDSIFGKETYTDTYIFNNDGSYTKVEN